MKQGIKNYFEFDKLNTDFKTEILAGITTFLTMSYIIFVNPSILRDAGMPPAAVAAATCVAASAGSFLMGIYARYPIALAPGMGINAYFAYTVVIGMGIPWQTALGAVFLSGLVFLVLTLIGVQQAIVSAIPKDLYAAVGGGIGLFLALIGLKNIGLITGNTTTLVALGDLTNTDTLIGLFGLLLTAGLLAWNIKAGIVIGILITAVILAMTSPIQEPETFRFAELTATWGELDIYAALNLGLLEIIFVFWFVDLFDNIGTLVAVGKRARLFPEQGEVPRIKHILLSDGAATTFGAMCGTSTVVSYIESAAGIAAGGRSGFSAAIVGLCFLISILFTPWIGIIPSTSTAPALILVGCLMMSTLREINWDDMETAAPAFLTIIMIPLSYSIANGLAIGFVTFTTLKIFRGKGRSISVIVYGLTILFVVRFFYMGVK